MGFKKTKGYVILISAMLCLFAAAAAGCGKEHGEAGEMKAVTDPEHDDIANYPQSTDSLISPVSGKELTASVQSEKEAKEIAAGYGIEFVDYTSGVAVFHTEEDPSSVIERGKKDGLPELSLNTMATTFPEPAVPGELKVDKNVH
ncbi:MAG: hypothetical protein K5985_08360 [Lachnospiraceae bacterium]|nr:hypothetical protein [Lachnospiraceae bacterium]